MSLLDLIGRWMPRGVRIAPPQADLGARDAELHRAFKGRPGDGPFLLSYDGRVIPLRKAEFLQDRKARPSGVRRSNRAAHACCAEQEAAAPDMKTVLID